MHTKDKMRLLYTAPLYDASGYSNFARRFVLALNELGIYVKTKNLTIGKVNPRINDKDKSILQSLEARPEDKFDIQIINILPQDFHQHYQYNMKNVGFSMFETDRIPQKWVQACNKMDAMLVPCKWNVETFTDSGVFKPIYNVPIGINPIKQVDELALPPAIAEDHKDIYKFYSIFEWTERKNPKALLHAYYSAFTGRDDVVLFIKTYKGEDTPENRASIMSEVESITNNLKLKHYPKVVMMLDIMTDEEMSRLHHTCDCFVLPTRGEGVGLPTLEAMAHGKPVITTNFGGSLEFCTHNNSILIDGQPTFVYNMPWIDVYEGDMTWYEPNVAQLSDKMYGCYLDRYLAEVIGKVAKSDIESKFNMQTCTLNLVKTLKKIINEN